MNVTKGEKVVMKVVRVSKKVYETERKDVESRISKLEDNCFRNSETVDISTKGCTEKENSNIKKPYIYSCL